MSRWTALHGRFFCEIDAAGEVAFRLRVWPPSRLEWREDREGAYGTLVPPPWHLEDRPFRTLEYAQAYANVNYSIPSAAWKTEKP